MVPIKTKKSPRATERATMVMVLGDAMEALGTSPSEAFSLWLPARAGGCQPPLKEMRNKAAEAAGCQREGDSASSAQQPPGPNAPQPRRQSQAALAPAKRSAFPPLLP